MTATSLFPTAADRAHKARIRQQLENVGCQRVAPDRANATIGASLRMVRCPALRQSLTALLRGLRQDWQTVQYGGYGDRARAARAAARIRQAARELS